MQENSVKIQIYSEKLINLFDKRKKYFVRLFIPQFSLIN